MPWSCSAILVGRVIIKKSRPLHYYRISKKFHNLLRLVVRKIASFLGDELFACYVANEITFIYNLP